MSVKNWCITVTPCLQVFYQQNYYIPDADYTVDNYTSPLLHHTLLENLPTASDIYYEVSSSFKHMNSKHALQAASWQCAYAVATAMR